jgi:demethylmenaquinone methyltransferase/2-methoxy-6-polyprenyl-1,4-benzoquinol methylase
MKIFDTSQAPGVGSRPKGARDERDSARRVRDMFSAIAPRYDLLNHLLSFSMDNRWRRLTAKKFSGILRRTDARILDLCCGTGDLAFAFEATRVKIIRDSTAHRAPIVGCDFAYPMVERARKKARAGSRSAEFINGDAMKMPFPDKTFDLIATAFGFRNLANYADGLREIARVLRPGGRVAILEFSEPNNTVMAKMYRFYFKRILPVIGGMISGNRAAYAYLPNSVSNFPPPPQLAKLMGSNGFSEIRYQSWNFGSVVLHTGKTPGAELPAIDLQKEFGPPRRRKVDFGIRDEVRENWKQKFSQN